MSEPLSVEEAKKLLLTARESVREVGINAAMYGAFAVAGACGAVVSILDDLIATAGPSWKPLTMVEILKEAARRKGALN